MVNVLENPKLSESLKIISGFFESLGIEWYVHAGMSLFLNKLNRPFVTDVDLRFKDMAIEDLFDLLKNSNENICDLELLAPPFPGDGEDKGYIQFNIFGILYHLGSFFNPKIDGKQYKIPFSKNISKIDFNGIFLPVCSVEDTLLYKLIEDRSKDVGDIKIISKNKINKEYLMNLATEAGAKEIVEDYLSK